MNYCFSISVDFTTGAVFIVFVKNIFFKGSVSNMIDTDFFFSIFRDSFFFTQSTATILKGSEDSGWEIVKAD